MTKRLVLMGLILVGVLGLLREAAAQNAPPCLEQPCVTPRPEPALPCLELLDVLTPEQCALFNVLAHQYKLSTEAALSCIAELQVEQTAILGNDVYVASVEDIGSVLQLRMQMVMERVTVVMQIVSNLMQKVSATQTLLDGNLK
jgi:hypothetical protein